MPALVSVTYQEVPMHACGRYHLRPLSHKGSFRPLPTDARRREPHPSCGRATPVRPRAMRASPSAQDVALSAGTCTSWLRRHRLLRRGANDSASELVCPPTSSPRGGPNPESSGGLAGIQALGELLKYAGTCGERRALTRGLAKSASYCEPRTINTACTRPDAATSEPQGSEHARQGEVDDLGLCAVGEAPAGQCPVLRVVADLKLILGDPGFGLARGWLEKPGDAMPAL